MKIFNIFKRKPKNNQAIEPSPEISPSLELSYIQPNGTKWFTFKNYSDAAIIRKIKIEEAATYAQMKISKDRLFAAIQRIENALNVPSGQKIDLSIIYLEINNLKTQMMFEAELESILEVIASLTIWETENPSNFDDKIHLAKKKALKEDADCADFFLRAMIDTFMNLQITYIADLREYFNKTRKVSHLLKTNTNTTHYDPSTSTPK